MTAVGLQVSYGQISAGPLSRVHENLEGISNCVQCHESGREISGAKCLACHTEIKAQIDARKGFHFSNAAASCITCHKEHLGRDARITRFDEKQFDHTKTGFMLDGKHAPLSCEQCHAEKNIKSSEVRKILAEHPHKTFLGLDQRCNSCHPDRHRGTLSLDCQSCHTTNAWSPASVFDHAKAKYPLLWKHRPVDCAKCHEGMGKKGTDQPVLFSTKDFADCRSCHTSPHGSRFADKTCSSCHTPEGWNVVVSFNHTRTRFPLTGKHADVPCAKCHARSATNKSNVVSFATKEFVDCRPCHTSPHGPGMARQQCKSCHDPGSWKMQTNVQFDHTLTKFSLEGRHASIKCEQCHKPLPKAAYLDRYRIKFGTCVSCHADYHGGQFGDRHSNDCAACHTLRSFKPSTFDLAKHAETKLPLTGGHGAVPCRECHGAAVRGGKATISYRGIDAECQGCHKDVHGKQFEQNGQTLCRTCHTPNNWRSLAFNHETMSTFPLTGAHRRVPCVACHKTEQVGGQVVVRYRPLSSLCESCHQGRQG